jgi:hypothetical protein
MAEGEPPQSSDIAVRAFIGLFVLGAILHGFDVMKDGVKSAVTWWVVGGGLAVFDWYWVRIKTRLGSRFAATANRVATDFRWWAGALIAVFLGAGAIEAYERSARLAGLDILRPGVAIPLIFCALCIAGLMGYIAGRPKRTQRAGALTRIDAHVPQPSNEPTVPRPLSEYDQQRRRQEIDELVQSIVTGETLKSVNHARELWPEVGDGVTG